MSYYDVIIIGGGPAGAAASYDLSKAGFSALILDKKEFPRFKACAGAVTAKALSHLRFSIDSIVHNTSNMIILGKEGLPEYQALTSDLPFCALTIRSELDKFCLDKSLKNGVKFDLISGLKSLDEQKDGVTIISKDNRSFSCRYLIGADGVHSQVRKLSKQFKENKNAFAIEATVLLAHCSFVPACTFNFGIVPNGYGWIFPKHDHVNVGIYTQDDDKKIISKAVLYDYVWKKLGTDKLENICGFPLGIGGEHYKPASNRIFLVGDAAGMTEPIFGEGIQNAIKSGQAVAKALIQAKQGDITPRQAVIQSIAIVQKESSQQSLKRASLVKSVS